MDFDSLNKKSHITKMISANEKRASMRIVIDMQGAQASNKERGIGRYTLSLAKAMVRNSGGHEVYLVLNALFPNTIESIRAAFYGLLPQQNIRIWESPGPISSSDDSNIWHRQAAELVRESFLASLNPDIVLVSSFFEGLEDNAVTSIGKLSNTIPTAVILYDLTPPIPRDHYLKNSLVEAWYKSKLENLRQSHLLLAISESSRQEAIHYLDFESEACVNISTAAEVQFQPQKIGLNQEQEICQRYGLTREFVMCNGDIEDSKNIEGLIRAYAKLPSSLRIAHQLVIVCPIHHPSCVVLEALAKKEGLNSDELVFTGFLPEEDLLALYNLSKAFVLPSWHEEFALPAIEAMSCGRAVIGANVSGLPEVIGRSDALFDPMNDESITEKLSEVLMNDSFRFELEQHGLKQAKRFSWDTSAQLVIYAVEAWHSKKSIKTLTNVMPVYRPKLAYISPLPPERSGISDYSAELLPELSRHYEIDVIVTQDHVSTTWINENCKIRDVEWFKANSDGYDRIIYHFGNSPFHQHMFSLLKEIPGIVVLHEFFLAHVLGYIEGSEYQTAAWSKALYHSHGYKAVKQRFHASEAAEVIWSYPCNFEVLQSALGVIVHSEHPRQLATQWFGHGTSEDWAVIPLLRVPKDGIDKYEARRQLMLDNNDFVVCSFGLLGSTKLNHRLLNAWLGSTLARNNNCVLIFVGENNENKYEADLLTRIRESGLDNRIRITGWTDSNTFQHYLAAADVAVQLREYSRGETSAAVLDCMNYGLPTIVNAHGSLADLPEDGVWKMSEQFNDLELTAALESLFRDQSRRQQLSVRAQQIIHTLHAPRACGDQYAQAVEAMYLSKATGVHSLISALTLIKAAPIEQIAWVGLVSSIAQSIPNNVTAHQLFVDISAVVIDDLKTGIQRVVRSILQELLSNPPAGYRIEPVYGDTNGQGYRYARKYTLQMLDCPNSFLNDDIIEFNNGDLFLGLDFHHSVTLANDCYYQKMRNYGVQVYFIVYDLLPVQFPHFWNPIHKIDEIHHNWLSVLSKTDGVICISNAVADELSGWLKVHGPKRLRPFKIGWFHLGADIDASIPSKGISADGLKILGSLDLGQSFLMVGTVEPRKGYVQTLAAFEKLWDQGVAVNLVIIGKQGWMVEDLAEKLRKHPKLGSQLFWLEGISDEYLQKVYAHSTCLIAASHGEGFGLPLIEAAQLKLPIIARDIPVFREVASNNAYYFSGLESDDLAHAIINWLLLYRDNKHPSSANMPWLTWKESAESLKKLIDGYTAF